MKKYYFLIMTYGILILHTSFVSSAETKKTESDSYNSALAKKLGADDYGMKSYVLAILKTGAKDTEITDKKERSKIFSGHFENMKRLANEGKLVLAGPLMEDKPKRGLFIFNVVSIEEAKELVASDPAVKAGIFTFELTKYYGSAALMEINRIHKSIQKTKIE